MTKEELEVTEVWQASCHIKKGSAKSYALGPMGEATNALNPVFGESVSRVRYQVTESQVPGRWLRNSISS